MPIDVSVVLPTHDRADALRTTFPMLCALDGVDEIIVVDDGSSQDVAAAIAPWLEGRVRVLRLPRRRGTPAARNAGVAAARGRWVLFGEDDCCFPHDYVRVLRREADAHGAAVVGAPMLHPRPGQSVADAWRMARRRALGPNGLDGLAGVPHRTLATPLVPAPALVARSVALTVRFDESYRGNAYREETDFFVRAARAGAMCVLTPGTFFWEPRRWPGGHRRNRIAHEWWTLVNNARFMARHGRWLQDQGVIGSPVGEQLGFLRRRATMAFRGER